MNRTEMMLVALLIGVATANAQRYEITPLFGARAGGSMKLQQEGEPVQARASLSDGPIFGVAGGFRFDEEECDACSVVEFRWMRQKPDLYFKATSPVVNPLTTSFGRVGVTIDHYLADFTHEWPIQEAPAVRPFVMASLGAARLSTSVTANTRFVFGLGGGVKVFPSRHWGVRFHAEYLPMVMHSEVQRVTCLAACVVALQGGLLNQFEFVVGPVFRFR
jgi:hypothetical protein